MITLLIFAFRLVLFSALTFAFVVLYEHGPSDFLTGVPTEWKKLTTLVESVRSTPPPAPTESGLVVEPPLPES